MSERPMIRPYKTVRKTASTAKFIESVLQAYDPDAAYALQQTKNPVVVFLEKLQKHGDASVVQAATIIEVNRLGLWRTRKVDGNGFREALATTKAKTDVLRKIAESGVTLRRERGLSDDERAGYRKLTESAKFREDWGDSSDGNDNTYDEYIPIMGGPWSHQLYLHDFLDMHAKCFEAFNHNPYAHQGVKLITHFVLGRGVVFKAHDPQVQRLFKKWWDREQMDDRLESWSDMLSRDGELLVRRFINPVTREFFLRWISPSTVWEIVTDIEDIEQVYYYHQQYPAAYQVLYGAPNGGKAVKIDPNKFESSKYIINQIPAEEVYGLKINVGPDEKRGRSDLFCILSWLKRHKDHQTGVVLKAIVQGVFAWKNKLKGSDTDVAAYISAFGTDVPDFGSIHVENEASELTPMTTENQSGTIQDAPSLVQTICVGLGVPAEYFGGKGGSGESNRAAAVVQSEPGVKKFQSRQLMLGRFLRRIAKDWVANEIACGRLPAMVAGDDPDLGIVMRWLQKGMQKLPALAPSINALVTALGSSSLMVPIDKDIEFQFPEIAVEDRSAKIKDLQTAYQEKVYDHKTFATAVAKELGANDYDYDATQEAIDSDAESGRGVQDLYGGMGIPGATNATGDQRPGKPGVPGDQPEDQPAPSGGLSGEERRSVKQNDRR